jgi:hypothetical protein
MADGEKNKKGNKVRPQFSGKRFKGIIIYLWRKRIEDKHYSISSFRRRVSFSLLPSHFCLLTSALSLLPSYFCLLTSAFMH